MLVELDVDGDVQIRRRLLRWAENAADASPAWEQIIMGGGARASFSLRKHLGKQFASQGKYASGGWVPLAPFTVAYKARHGLDPRILHATGRLAASLTGPGPGHIEDVRPAGFTFGTEVPYARIHQKGGARVPRRRPIELREQDRREMVRILQRHLVSDERGSLR